MYQLRICINDYERMFNMKKILFVCFMLFLTGCTSLGEQFNELQPNKPGKALVYFYRPSQFLGFGGGMTYDIHENDSTITPLCSGGYNYYYTTPGNKTYWAKTEARDEISLNVESGKTYFVKGKMGIGFIVGHPKLSQVDQETAMEEMKECRIILKDDGEID